MGPVFEMCPAASDERHVERHASTIYNRAVVMGGSMAGLAAARVLSDHYRECITQHKRLIGSSLVCLPSQLLMFVGPAGPISTGGDLR